MQFLQIPKHDVLADYKEKLASYEFQIVKIVNFGKRKLAAQQQQAQNPPPHMHSGSSLPQNSQSGPQQVNINPLPQQQNGVMYPGNGSITQGACGVVGDSSFESRDWRSRLQADSRQRSVNKITDTLKRHCPLSGNEGLKELKKIAENFEEKMYTEATSEENKPQNPMPNAVKSNSAAISVNPSGPVVASLDLTAEKGNPDGEDWQEEVYQKIKAMKDLYLQDLKDIRQQILDHLQKHDSLPQQPDNGQLEKLRVFKMTLERFMHFLQIPKHDILANYKDKLATDEMEIVDVVNSNKRKVAAQDQQPQAPLPPHMHSGGSLQQNVLRGPQQENINPTSLQKDGTVTAVNSNKRKRVGRKKQQQAPPPAHVHSGGSLQQNMPSGPQQVNINPASLQQNLGGSGASGGFMKSGNWKARMTARSIAEKITDSLKTHLQYYGFEGIPELMKISERFEESVYTAATSQSEYLEILSLKMMNLETKQQPFRPDGYMH